MVRKGTKLSPTIKVRAAAKASRKEIHINQVHQLKAQNFVVQTSNYGDHAFIIGGQDRVSDFADTQHKLSKMSCAR